LANGVVNPTVGSKLKGIQVPGQQELLPGGFDLLQGQVASRFAISQLGMVLIDFLGLIIMLQRGLEVPRLLTPDPLLKQLLPPLQRFSTQTTPMQRSQRGEILEV
jgi:hypothetical protein